VTTPAYDRDIAALLVVDPYNDFISEGGKIWARIKVVAEANNCVPNMLEVLSAARKAKLRVFYAMHHRYRPGDYETWTYIAPIQKGAWQRKAFEYATWGRHCQRHRFAHDSGQDRDALRGGAVRRQGGNSNLRPLWRLQGLYLGNDGRVDPSFREPRTADWRTCQARVAGTRADCGEGRAWRSTSACVHQLCSVIWVAVAHANKSPVGLGYGWAGG